MVIPDIVLFVNGIPLVVMEAKSPSLLDVWKTNAVRQLRRYQEAGPEWRGSGAPGLFHYNLLCVAHCGAAAAYASVGAPENAYFEWKWLGNHSDDDVRQKYGVEPQGQAQLIVGLFSPATLLEILRDFVVYELEWGRVVKKLPPVPAVPGGAGNYVPYSHWREAHRAWGRGLAHPGFGQIPDHAMAGHENQGVSRGWPTRLSWWSPTGFNWIGRSQAPLSGAAFPVPSRRLPAVTCGAC